MSVASSPSPSSSSSVCACLPMWPLTLLATIELHARAGLLSRRGFPVELAAAKICRKAGARSPRMSWSVIWTWPFHSKPLTADNLKSWLMGFTCLEECNCHRHHFGEPGARECPWQPQDGGKNALTQNWWVLARARLVVLAGEVGGRWSARLRVSCVCWQQPRQTRTPDLSEASGVRLAVPMGSDPELPHARSRVHC